MTTHQQRAEQRIERRVEAIRRRNLTDMAELRIQRIRKRNQRHVEGIQEIQRRLMTITAVETRVKERKREYDPTVNWGRDGF